MPDRKQSKIDISRGFPRSNGLFKLYLTTWFDHDTKRNTCWRFNIYDIKLENIPNIKVPFLENTLSSAQKLKTVSDMAVTLANTRESDFSIRGTFVLPLSASRTKLGFSYAMQKRVENLMDSPEITSEADRLLKEYHRYLENLIEDWTVSSGVTNDNVLDSVVDRIDFPDDKSFFAEVFGNDFISTEQYKALVPEEILVRTFGIDPYQFVIFDRKGSTGSYVIAKVDNKFYLSQISIGDNYSSDQIRIVVSLAITNIVSDRRKNRLSKTS